MSQLTRLKLKIDFAVLHYSAIARDTVFGARLPELFIDYLIALHQFVRAIDHLLQVASQEAERRWQAGDASCRGLAEYYVRRRSEEGHHAAWLLEDIEALGLNGAEVLAKLPPPEVAALPGSQLYWIMHHHPATLFGYLIVLEAYPLHMEDIDHFREQTGLPEAAFRTMRLHAEEDPGHAEEIFRFLEQSAFTDELYDAITCSALTTCQQLAAICQALAAAHNGTAVPAVATVPTVPNGANPSQA
jgi:hypothetical protein